jgi:hypothetical protein
VSCDITFSAAAPGAIVVIVIVIRTISLLGFVDKTNVARGVEYVPEEWV